ncbi:SRPBCC family protein [Mucilaginibacter endophyticus]|uniref:SRPBCC family protein n=1 Tax=Mucilaginibacter endophyticus TaxID=2675003 RepID=UPI001FC9E04D|nr:SRPBCC family protein [Mucilaginibacter endophyticus]
MVKKGFADREGREIDKLLNFAAARLQPSGNYFQASGLRSPAAGRPLDSYHSRDTSGGFSFFCVFITFTLQPCYAIVKTYVLKREQKIPITLNDAWEFFSSPLNLAKITPKDMGFVVTSDYTGDSKMYAGMIITYKISPLLGIKMDWMTEITHVDDKKYFVDEQRFGPYALWHHQHHFKEIESGVHMTDLLHYAIPYGAIGRFANAVFVKSKIEQIFDYRTKVIEELFGKL